MKMLNYKLVENTVWNLIRRSILNSERKSIGGSVLDLIYVLVKTSVFNITNESVKDCIDEDIIHQ